jgi:hypothetical protein
MEDSTSRNRPILMVAVMSRFARRLGGEGGGDEAPTLLPRSRSNTRGVV